MNETKESGVAWMGRIPKSWNVSFIRQVARLESGHTPSRKNDKYWVPEECTVPWVSLSDVWQLRGGTQKYISDTKEKISEVGIENSGARILPKGTVILSRTASVGFSGIMSEAMATTQDFVNWVCNDDIIPDFLLYVLRGMKSEFKFLAQGSTHQTIYMPDIRKLKTPIPPLDTQRQIATYLDKKTRAIDELIAKKQRMIALLEEKRSALINHVVTKGLDPDVRMKDSGVEWIGEVPEHWDTVFIRRVARLESGHTPSRKNDSYWVPSECVVPWISLSDVWQLRDGRKKYIFETKERISHLGINNSGARILPEGTVILSRTASVGFSCIMSQPMATTQDFVNWVCGENMRSEYLLYSFKTMKSEFEFMAQGSTHKTIYMPDMRKMKVPLPPVDEQDEIAEFIDKSAESFEHIVDKTKRIIVSLGEYRQALITAAVTGKLDVTNDRMSSDPEDAVESQMTLLTSARNGRAARGVDGAVTLRRPREVKRCQRKT